MAYVDVDGLSKYSGFAVPTLNKWRTSGKGPPFSKFGKAIRYDTGKFDDWFAAHERRSTSEPPLCTDAKPTPRRTNLRSRRYFKSLRNLAEAAK